MCTTLKLNRTALKVILNEDQSTVHVCALYHDLPAARTLSMLKMF